MRIDSNIKLKPNFIKNSLSDIKPKSLNMNNKKGLMLGLLMLASANIANLKINKSNALYAQEATPSVTSIDKSFGEYGKYYMNNIPEGENIQEHAKCLNEIRTIYKDIQGCEFNNPAILNGLTAEELRTKVIEPATKLANGEKFGANQNNLVFMIFENSCDKTNAFKKDLEKNTFNTHTDSLDGLKFSFKEAFLQHYDNIILLQPNNGQSADKTLDTMFAKLENCLDANSNLDIIFEGHGVNKSGVRLSPVKSTETSLMDLSDFAPKENNGNDYAQSIKKIFINSIDNGYSPKIIGVGCSSDYMQSAVDAIMPDEYKNSVKVFGTPYETIQSVSIGYSNGALEMITYTAPIKDNKGFIIKLTDGNWKKPNDKTVETFMINPDKKDDKNRFIIDQYFTDGIQSGSLSKESGVVMQYFIRDFSNKKITH